MEKTTFKGFKKRTKIVLLACILLLTTIASTFAWFKASSQVTQKIQLGNLKIEATFTPPDTTNYEPGLTAETHGTIKNTGTIPAIVGVKNNSSITFAYSDDNLTPIPVANRQPEAIDPNAVKITYVPTSGSYDDNADVIWFADAAGNNYFVIEVGATANVDLNVTFDGPNTTNKYMDAVVDIKADVTGTQVLDGAIQSEFGISADDLILLPITRNVQLDRANRLEELLNR